VGSPLETCAVFVGGNLVTDGMVSEEEAKEIMITWVLETDDVDGIWITNYFTDQIHTINNETGRWEIHDKQ